MALDLNDLNDLQSFLGNYDEQFQQIQVSKTPVELPEGNYTGKIIKIGFDKTQTGNKYLLKFEVEVLTAKEPANADQIGNVTSKTLWIDPASNKLNNQGEIRWVADIKQNLYDIGLPVLTNVQLSQLADPVKSILPNAIGNIVKFKRQNGVTDDKTYANLYFQGLIMKALETKVNNVVPSDKTVTEDDLPF